jgi:hypothetical protein
MARALEFLPLIPEWRSGEKELKGVGIVLVETEASPGTPPDITPPLIALQTEFINSVDRDPTSVYCVPTDEGPVYVTAGGAAPLVAPIRLRGCGDLDDETLFSHVYPMLVLAPGVLSGYLYLQRYYLGAPNTTVFLTITNEGSDALVTVTANRYSDAGCARLTKLAQDKRGRPAEGIYVRCGDHIAFLCGDRCAALFESPGRGRWVLVPEDGELRCVIYARFRDEVCRGFSAAALELLQYVLGGRD